MYCNVCGEPTSNRCASCKSAWYCCREHQLQDWKFHKNLCKLFTDGVKESWFDPNGMSSVKKWPNGTIYRGNLMGAKPHGRGAIFYPNGDVCGGVWKHGQLASGKWAGEGQPHLSFGLIGLSLPSDAEVDATKIRLGLTPFVDCTHGFNNSSADDGIIKDFICAWQAAFNVDTSSNQTFEDKFQKAHDATITKFYKVWSKLENMELMKKFLFNDGTNYILRGVLWRCYTYDHVASGAAVACYFDQYVDVFLKKTQATMNWAKIKKLKLCGADEHALVKYFRSHIPCSCLDGIHKELKGETRRQSNAASAADLKSPSRK